jgi:bisanhydrobacterioruberin hydratase
LNAEKTPRARTHTAYTYAIYLLISMHLAGFMGLQWAFTRPWFEALIPFNLLTTAGLLFYFHLQWNRHFIFFILIASLSGYWIEVLGVKTEMIFGSYQYKTTLGFKVLEVPLLIGINWLVLVYASGAIVQFGQLHRLWRAMLAASLMVLMDYWIEPFAIRHQMWAWADNIVPLQNYVGWWITAFGLQISFNYLQFLKQNRLALPLFVTQLIFFLAHNLVYYLE